MEILYTDLISKLQENEFDVKRSNSTVYGGSTIARKSKGTVVFRRLNNMDYMMMMKNVEDLSLLQLEARSENVLYYVMRVSKIDGEYMAFVFSSDLGCSYSELEMDVINDVIIFCTVDNKLKNQFTYLRFMGEWVRTKCMSKNSFSTCVKLKQEDVKAMFKLLKRDLKKKPEFSHFPRKEGSKGAQTLLRVNNQWVLEKGK